MAKEKALFGVWGELKASEINRLLKAHGVRLVVKGSKLWGEKVNVTAQVLDGVNVRVGLSYDSQRVTDAFNAVTACHATSEITSDELDARSRALELLRSVIRGETPPDQQ